MKKSPHPLDELRERTGAGLSDCQQALAETDGDVDAAAAWLHDRGLGHADGAHHPLDPAIAARARAQVDENEDLDRKAVE